MSPPLFSIVCQKSVTIGREFRVTENTHFRCIKTTDFIGFTDSQWGDEVTELEPDHAGNESEDEHDSGTQQLSIQLGRVTVEETANTVRSGFWRSAKCSPIDTVPSTTVGAVGEETEGDYAPCPVHAVNRNCTDRVINSDTFPEEHTQDDQYASNTTDNRG